MKQRCNWATHASPLIQTYHDTTWGIPVFDDHILFKYLVMESAHAGLSWEIVLKREHDYDLAYEGFNPLIVAQFDEDKVRFLLTESKIIRHEGKIRNSIIQAKVFNEIVKEFGSFSSYLWSFVDHKPLVTHRDPQVWDATSRLSDTVSLDLKKRGMKYVGSKIIQAYLQGVGIINDHDTACDLCLKGEQYAEENT
jgi:DNA-3-methyladenine glycosylase I